VLCTLLHLTAVLLLVLRIDAAVDCEEDNEAFGGIADGVEACDDGACDPGCGRVDCCLLLLLPLMSRASDCGTGTPSMVF
jgi:hypothetical protein